VTVAREQRPDPRQVGPVAIAEVRARYDIEQLTPMIAGHPR
jgi:hypothetical protein